MRALTLMLTLQQIPLKDAVALPLEAITYTANNQPLVYVVKGRKSP